MYISNKKYRINKTLCKVDPFHRRGDRLYLASIEFDRKNKSNPINFCAIPVQILRTEITTFYEENMTYVFYHLRNLHDNTEFFVNESQLYLTIGNAYSAIQSYIDSVIEKVKAKEQLRLEYDSDEHEQAQAEMNLLLIAQGIAPVKKDRPLSKLISYLEGKSFQAQITSENI